MHYSEEDLMKDLGIRKPHSFKADVIKLVAYVFMTFVALFMLLPFVWMLASSFKPMRDIFAFPPSIVGPRFIIDNYLNIFKQYPFALNMWNSFYIAALFTILAVFFCSLAGFAFAKYHFKGKGFLFAFLVATMAIPFETTLVPLYVIFKQLHWIDKHIGLIIPGIANAFGIYFMRQNMLSIPDDLIEAARIDGCGELGIFFKIILPVIRPAMASLGIIFFMNSWNNFLWPLIILKSDTSLTVPVLLRNLSGDIHIPYDLIMAGSVLSVLPLVAIFLIFQRQFISGIMEGAIKG